MSDLLTFELSTEQREVLLRGLRYVRSSIMLDVEDPTPELVESRRTQLTKVAVLSDLLNGKPVAQEARV